jgi:hypothetical protein
MIKILYKVELGAKKSNEEFDAELNKFWELPFSPNQHTAVVHLQGKQFYVIYESDSLIDPKTLVAGSEQEIMEAVAKN